MKTFIINKRTPFSFTIEADEFIVKGDFIVFLKSYWFDDKTSDPQTTTCIAAYPSHAISSVEMVDQRIPDYMGNL